MRKIFDILKLKEKLKGPVITYVRTDFRDEDLTGLCKNVRRLNDSLEYPVFSCSYNGKAINFVGTGSSAANVLTALYEIYACKAKTVVRIGACGGLNRNAKVNQVVVVRSSVCMDRISLRLGCKKRTLANEESARSIMRNLEENNIEFVFDTVGSVDGMYLFENDAKRAEKYYSAYCWDLETAAVLAFGKKFGVETASVLLIVSDNQGEAIRSYPPINRLDFVERVIDSLADGSSTQR
jgi:uridine phosphorylase